MWLENNAVDGWGGGGGVILTYAYESQGRGVLAPEWKDKGRQKERSGGLQGEQNGHWAVAANEQECRALRAG